MIKNLKIEALKHKKENNTKAALFALRKKKLYEQELTKIDGMKFMLEQQKLALEQAAVDHDVFGTLKASDAAIKEASIGVSADAFEELKDSMDEQNQLRSEISDFFGNQVSLDDPDLEKELNGLDEELSQSEIRALDELSVPQGSVHNAAKGVPIKPASNQQELDEQRQLEELMK